MRARLLRVASAVAVAVLAIGGFGALPAVADGPTTYSNTALIAVPAAGSPSQIGPANPYPSAISVAGMAGPVTKVTVSFVGLTHPIANDIDALLVAPTGANLLVMSDTSNANTFTFANNATLTFDDAALGAIPGAGEIPTGSYKPTNLGGGDTFPAPAPAPSAQTTLAGAFTGINPNGTWHLYIVDDASGDVGSLSGGWSLSITTAGAAVDTTTALTSSLNPSSAGQGVTFTATVTAGGSPVSTGTVTFTEGASVLAAAVPVAADGKATLTTSALSVGTHSVTATYSGTAAFAASSGSVSQVVQKASTLTTLTSSVNPSSAGQSVEFTATVTAGGSPVSTGTVTFTDGASVLAAAVPVAADGTAKLATSTLSVAMHTITATYSGTVALVGSSGIVAQNVFLLVIADAGGPYTVAEGESLTLDGTGSTSGDAYEWDVNGDGSYGDASGASPTLTWADLEALGVDDGPALYAVTLRAVSGQQSDTDATSLEVANTAPDTVVTGDLNAAAGTEFTVKVGADDPSSADMASPFTYEVDWGDGSAIETVTGPADPPVSHTYATGGSYSAAFVAIDQDGGRSAGVIVTVQVTAPPSPTPSPTPPPDPAPLPPTGVEVTAPLAIGGGLLVVGLTVLLLQRAARRR